MDKFERIIQYFEQNAEWQIQEDASTIPYVIKNVDKEGSLLRMSVQLRKHVTTTKYTVAGVEDIILKHISHKIHAYFNIHQSIKLTLLPLSL